LDLGKKTAEGVRRGEISLAKVPVLACPDFKETFELQTDASDDGLGVLLTQKQEGEERVIAYARRTLNQAGRNYEECLAVKRGIW
jgi:hypothetical protein